MQLLNHKLPLLNLLHILINPYNTLHREPLPIPLRILINLQMSLVSVMYVQPRKLAVNDLEGRLQVSRHLLLAPSNPRRQLPRQHPLMPLGLIPSTRDLQLSSDLLISNKLNGTSRKVMRAVANNIHCQNV